MRRRSRRIESPNAGAAEPAPLGGTTHISVVDVVGNAASLSASTGSGLWGDRAGHGHPDEQHARRVRPEPGGRVLAPGRRMTSMMAPRSSSSGHPRLVVGSAGSVRLRGAIMQVVVNVVGHGLPVDEAIDRRACTSTSRTSTARAVRSRARSRRSRRRATTSSAGGAGTCSSAASQRWSGARTAALPLPAIHAGAEPASSSGHERLRRPRGRAGGRAGTRRARAAGGAEPEGWLIADDSWRGVADERRYLKAIRRHPHAAVFVAEEDGEIVGRLSVARDPHPASFHVADLGLMVVASHRRRGVGVHCSSARWNGPRVACPQARASRLPTQRACDRALRELRLRPRGLPATTTTAAEPGTSTRS